MSLDKHRTATRSGRISVQETRTRQAAKESDAVGRCLIASILSVGPPRERRPTLHQFCGLSRLVHAERLPAFHRASLRLPLDLEVASGESCRFWEKSGIVLVRCRTP